jgi:hypothetical protein
MPHRAVVWAVKQGRRGVMPLVLHLMYGTADS